MSRFISIFGSALAAGVVARGIAGAPQIALRWGHRDHSLPVPVRG
jgi:hypothetical protein